LIVQIHIAEYNKLREEINVYHDHQKEEIYFAMLVLGGIFATIFSQNIASLYPEVFLLFPFILTALALAYADRTVRILRIATYIHQCLRENLVEELGARDFLQWEVFKKYRVAKRKERLESIKPSCIQSKVSLWFKRNLPELPLILDITRVAQFIMPSLFCIILFILLNNKPWDIPRLLAAAVVTVIAFLPTYFFVKSEETSGIDLASYEVNLAEWEKDQLVKPRQTK
jgi:hypothetical protein